MPYTPPVTPFRFRDMIIQKGVMLRELSFRAGISVGNLTAACNDSIIPYHDQMKIVWTLQKEYGIQCRRQDLFFTLKT